MIDSTSKRQGWAFSSLILGIGIFLCTVPNATPQLFSITDTNDTAEILNSTKTNELLAPSNLIELESLNDESNQSVTTTTDNKLKSSTAEPQKPYLRFGFGITGGNGTDEDRGRLIQDLLRNYDIRNYPSNVTVQLGASLISLNTDGLSRQNTFQTEIIIRKLWTDPRLQWNSSAYGGHTVISLPSNQVWKPDIRLLNSVALPSVKECDESNVLINRDGEVLWVAQCQYVASCLMEYTEPQHNCSLLFGSWAFGGSKMDLQFYKDDETGPDFTFFQDVTSVTVNGVNSKRIEKYFGFYSETFPVKIQFNFFFKRKVSNNYSSYSLSTTSQTNCGEGKRKADDGTCVDGVDFT